MVAPPVEYNAVSRKPLEGIPVKRQYKSTKTAFNTHSCRARRKLQRPT